MPAPTIDPRPASPRLPVADLPAVAGVAGGVGTSTVAAALGGRDLGVFTGRPADVVVCRATVASVLLAGRVTALLRATGRRGHRHRHRQAQWRAAVAAGAAGAAHHRGHHPALGAARGATWPTRSTSCATSCTRPAGKLPRPVGGYLAALAAIHTALHTALASPGLRSPAPPGRPNQAPQPISELAVPGRAARG